MDISYPKNPYNVGACGANSPRDASSCAKILPSGTKGVAAALTLSTPAIAMLFCMDIPFLPAQSQTTKVWIPLLAPLHLKHPNFKLVGLLPAGWVLAGFLVALAFFAATFGPAGGLLKTTCLFSSFWYASFSNCSKEGLLPSPAV